MRLLHRAIGISFAVGAAFVDVDGCYQSGFFVAMLVVASGDEVAAPRAGLLDRLEAARIRGPVLHLLERRFG